MSRLWERDRYRGLHPRQKRLLLRALLRGQGCPPVQPLQAGEPDLRQHECHSTRVQMPSSCTIIQLVMKGRRRRAAEPQLLGPIESRNVEDEGSCVSDKPGNTEKTKFGVEMKEPPPPTAGTTSVRALVCVPQALTKGGVTYKDEVWHKECFLCTGCSAPLAGQPFTSQGESPYCIRCFSSLYAKKCAGCNTAITGQ